MSGYNMFRRLPAAICIMYCIHKLSAASESSAALHQVRKRGKQNVVSKNFLVHYINST